MKVTNATKAAINYAGRSYGPNASFEVAKGDEQKPGVVRMLGDGRLTVGLSAGAAKPSDGLTADDIKKALADKGIAFDATAKKADLAALLDAAP